MDLFLNLFSTEGIINLVKTGGYLAILAIIFAESGLFFGFFLPGDSLIFTAGFLASQGFLNIWFLVPLLFIAAVLGDNVGYGFGKKVGPKIFSREDSIFFKKKYLDQAHDFYEKHGSKTIILARFIPVIRTFAPIVAGAGQMEYKTFFLFNIIGGALWTTILPVGGFYLGRIIPNPDRYLLPIIVFIIFLSILPGIISLLKRFFKK